MDNKLSCEYRFKFYINASHSIIINGKQGEVHPHTWEMMLNILVERTDFMEFNVYEQVAQEFFAQYQDCTLNDKKPFDTIVPTLENIVDFFGQEIGKRIREVGGILMRIEGSETPTRSYVVSYTDHSDYLEDVQHQSEEALSRVMDDMMDRALAES
ncbi:MAG: 6-carboxytetrahydropterin synthase [Lachnospiraceae bacterium]|nr:6-carboxytetrahydropterin synthase [Lachnospiraceae bacterium]